MQQSLLPAAALLLASHSHHHFSNFIFFMELYRSGFCVLQRGRDFFGAITPEPHIRTRRLSFTDRASQMGGEGGSPADGAPSRASTDDRRTATPSEEPPHPLTDVLALPVSQFR